MGDYPDYLTTKKNIMQHYIMQRVIFTLLFLIVIVGVYSQNVHSDKTGIKATKFCSLSLELKGKEYDKLQLIIIGSNDKVNVIDGKKQDIYNWEFIYSDSVYQTNCYMQLFIPTNNKHTLHIVELHLLSQKGDTIKKNVFNVSPNQKIIASKYNEYLKKNIPFYKGKDVKFEQFIVSEKEKTDFSLGALCPFYMIDKTDTVNYMSALNRFETLVKENNNSQFLLSNLRSSLLDFKSNENIQSVYTAFSDEMQKSVFGQQIKWHLETKRFANMKLKNCVTETEESIILNRTPYTLVVFSASWCAPCHKLIPRLKEIYQELNDAIEFVYVSIDEAKTIEEWRKLIKEESILWRSLTTLNRLDEVKHAYTVDYIPLAYLVYPDKTFEIIDINNKGELKKLYKLCGRSI